MSTNTLDGSTKNKEMESVLLDLVSALADGQKGFADIGEHLKDVSLKRYFLAESLKRANFGAELESELHRAGMADVKETGTVSGALHRSWGDFKAKLGAGDHSLLETAEQGEDEAVNAYQKALKHDLPLPIRQLLSEQQAQVLTSHNFVRSNRDALASK
ncbi:MAG: PA2169 family four-helix-bundle protein [Acidobacteriaceae bacterium]